MSVPVTMTITGCESAANLGQALGGVARHFKPMTGRQKVSILQKTPPVSRADKFEDYKSSYIYDETINNPQWLGRDRTINSNSLHFSVNPTF